MRKFPSMFSMKKEARGLEKSVVCVRSPEGCLGGSSVKCPTLDSSSGYDHAVRELKPHIGLCANSVGPAWDSLSPSLPAPPLLALSLSRKINKH